MRRTGQQADSSLRRLRLGGAILLAVAAIVAACATPGAGTSSPPASAAGSGSPPATAAAGGLAIAVATNPELGDHVTGANGLALYVFLNDSGGTSACTGDCAASWPPLTVASAGDVTPGSGVTGELGTIQRPDGTTQVTLGGAPLYYFAGDTAAGDANGQGIGGLWHLASPSGTPVGQAAASPGGGQPSATICSGRYCY